MSKLLKHLAISGIFTLFLFSSFCLADMTIWLRDGSSRQVRRIVFKGKVAELHLTNGTMTIVPVDKLDLESSGIGAPEGTYGETTLSPSNKRIGIAGTKGVAPGGGLKQSELSEQWDNSNSVAVAQKDIGAIRNGQTVKIVSRPGPDPPKGPSQYKSFSDYESTPPTDEAYVIIYKNPDGTFSKKLFDAATFTSAFKIIEPKSTSVTSEVPTVSPADRSPEVLTEGTPENSIEHQIQPNPRIGEAPREPSGIQKSEEPDPVTVHRRNRRDLAIPPGRPVRRVVGGAVVVVILIAAAVLLVKKKRPSVFIDTSRFRKYEEELRDFEIELWMKHGKTPDQLLEICVKKFYQDSLAALPVALKMLKTPDRSSIIPLIVKQSGRNPSDVENIYAEMKGRMESIRQLIRDSQQRFSKKILASVSQTAPPPTPSTQGKSQVAGTLSVAAPDPVVPPKKQLAEMGDAPSRSENLPRYLANILNQLSLLTRE